MMKVLLAVMLSLLCLTTVATSAAAECAWVLWIEVLWPEEFSSLRVTGAWATRAECEAERRRREAAAAKGVADFRRELKQLGEEVSPETGPPSSRLLCLPDTVDPRGGAKR